ncbi:hypothetical protein K2173_027090 [Erythroxylum novogranatense]|uniref:Serine aminopeptidase S33 domain-containing protein n=1 Tax=Erythroxylum novogranatense TaxID=1862640 RepID=A0AAV8TYE7_9ROSI|nr:hypothetical protein K2173_027090 [Erythroxylum novogranatense]
MATSGACFLAPTVSPVIRCCVPPSPSSSSSSSSAKMKRNPNPNLYPTRRFALVTEQTPSSTSETVLTSFQENGSFLKIHEKQHTPLLESETTTTTATEEKNRAEEQEAKTTASEEEEQSRATVTKNSIPYRLVVENPEAVTEAKKSLKDYFEASSELIRSDGGPPRWFSPMECGSRLHNSPLLLFLPGIDGVGLGLIRQHYNLGKIYDIWCLHIPVKDRTSFAGLVQLVERTVKSESNRSPNRPIYILGESLGACLALAVAARNPDIDLALILVNPATSFEKSQLNSLSVILEFMPDQTQLFLPYMLSLMTGDPLKMTMENVMKGLPAEHIVGGIAQNIVAVPSYLSVLNDILPRETLLWKLQMIKSASAYANSRLHAIRAQALILTSGKDQFLPSREEGERLRRLLLKSQIRSFDESDHFVLLGDNVDLVTRIKGASFYRRRKFHDYVADYIPPSPSEFKSIYDANSWTLLLSSPVMLSTLEDGKIVKGLAGIPLEGPVLFVGYHMLLGFELPAMVSRILMEKNILLRGIAHPAMFIKLRDGRFPELDNFDQFRLMGAVPVSGSNFYKLLNKKAHVLLYPGGVREACHRKGEEYKLFWPERSEFVRMAARFGAKIVPFGVVGEDDFAQVVVDYDDQMKIPFLRDYIKEIAEEAINVRTQFNGEVGNQDMHLPGMLPKFPGRFYYYFGKPFQTEGRKKELRDREKAHELYMEVKSEVEKCLAFLKERREHDPYRNIVARLTYQAVHGVTSEVPSFEL